MAEPKHVSVCVCSMPRPRTASCVCVRGFKGPPLLESPFYIPVTEPIGPMPVKIYLAVSPAGTIESFGEGIFKPLSSVWLLTQRFRGVMVFKRHASWLQSERSTREAIVQNLRLMSGPGPKKHAQRDEIGKFLVPGKLGKIFMLIVVIDHMPCLPSLHG